ncbi:hypothetical protein PS3A_60850 [Pseudomonas sp. 3A(2025)]
MKNQNGALAPTESACPKNTIDLFFVVHSKVSQPLLGPFPTAIDAECARLLIGCADAVVERRAVTSSDDFIHGHSVKNGKVQRVFIGVGSPWGRA